MLGCPKHLSQTSRSHAPVRLLSALLAGILGLTTFPGDAAAPTQVCDQNCFRTLKRCSLIDADCVTRSMAQVPRITACVVARAECKFRLGLYQLYMGRVSWGVSMSPLPASYIQALAPHFPNVNLTQVRVGYSSRQPDQNATTDCNNIYFNDRKMVRQVVDGSLWVGFTEGRPDPEKTSLDWLLHELRHVEQCREWGGREVYALRWMQDMTLAALRQMSLQHTQIHNDQVMERDADQVALAVLRRLGPDLDSRGQLVGR